MDTLAIDGERMDRASRARHALQSALAAVIPPVFAFGVESVLLAPVSRRWLVFTAAVLVSSWLGGFEVGIVATALSAVLLWWFLVPPERLFAATDPKYYVAVAFFIAIGIAVANVHRRLRLAQRETRIARLDAERAESMLERTTRQLQIFAALVENTSDFIGIGDERQRPIYVNPGGRRLVDYPDDLPVPRTEIPQYYPPDAHDFVVNVMLRTAVEQGEWEGETMMVNWRTGAAIPVWAKVFVIKDRDTGNSLGVATITRDISEFKRTRDELERAARQLQIFAALVENSSDFIGIADENRHPIYVNPGGRHLVDYPGDLPVQRTEIPQFYPPEAHDFIVNVMLRTMAEQGEWEGETTMINWRTDAVIPVWAKVFVIKDRDTGNVIGAATITRDISEFKRTRDELASTAADLKAAQRVAHVGSWSMDTRTGAVRWSEELYRIHGLDPAVPAPSWDKDFVRLYTAESMNTLKPAVEELQKHGTSFELELEAILPDGSHRWLRARGEPVRDAPGTIVAIRGITQDISRLKELERMKEEWTSMIAHDLRQPISAIKMSAALLPDLHAGSMANDEQIITERIRSGADALSRMVEDLLDVSRLEARGLTLDRAWLDPVTLVQKTLDHLSHATENHVVQVSVDGERSPVLVDPARFEQVLGNLLSNAVKYGEERGEIQVGVRQRDKEVEISVTNHGPGIPPDEIPRIFVRFARSPTARRAGVTGLGLGLYIAKGLVEAHGGRMWVESVPGKVTTFTFTLPSRGGARAAA